jgi:cytochrome P450
MFPQRMVPPFAACCSELICKWNDSVGSGDVEEVDVWPEFQNLTGDVISRAAFGSSFSEGRRIFQLQSEQAQNAVKMVQVMYIPGYRCDQISQTSRSKKITKIQLQSKTSNSIVVSIWTELISCWYCNFL